MPAGTVRFAVVLDGRQIPGGRTDEVVADERRQRGDDRRAGVGVDVDRRFDDSEAARLGERRGPECIGIRSEHVVTEGGDDVTGCAAGTLVVTSMALSVASASSIVPRTPASTMAVL